MLFDAALFKKSMGCRCPRCDEAALFKGRFSIDLNDSCHHCGLDFAKNDSADGPAVFLIFVLGSLLVPFAIAFEYAFFPPLWVHGVLWTFVALALTVGTLKPIKSYIIALQFKHRPRDWE